MEIVKGGKMDVFIPGVFYPVSAVASRLGIDPKTLYSLISAGELPCHRLFKRSFRLEGADLNAWLESTKEEVKEK